MTQDKFFIFLHGPLRVLAPDGNDITPRGSKAQAVIALLTEDSRQRRSRRWIESKLWSDRGPKQASGSLRQTLCEIRDAFGAHAGLLGSDRLMVWLEPDRIQSSLNDPLQAGVCHREILEGLDVRDSEFEDWLRALRHRHEAPAPLPGTPPRLAQRGLRLICTTSDGITGSDALIGRVIADQVGRNIAERVALWQVARDLRTLGGGPVGAELEVRCDVSRDLGQGVAYIRVSHCGDGRVLFSRFHRPAPGGDLLAEDFVSALAHEATLRTLEQLPEVIGPGVEQAVATGYCNIALQNLWSFVPARMAEAENLMLRAHGADGNAVYLAWISFIRMARVIERNERPDATFLEEVDEIARHALEQGQDNAMAQSLVALTRTLLFDDLDDGARIARDALRLNSGNLFARQALAVAGIAHGAADLAYRHSSFCQTAAGGDRGRHVWELYHALVCLANGRTDEAMHAAGRAVALCPDFVAPHRLLLALHASRADDTGAARHLAALTRLEPGFTLDAYLNDDSYPVDTLRRAGLLREVGDLYGLSRQRLGQF